MIVEGTVDVLVDGERVATLGPGEFFGELAALDWGAGLRLPAARHGRRARRRCGCSCFPDGALAAARREFPRLEREISGGRRALASDY